MSALPLDIPDSASPEVPTNENFAAHGWSFCYGVTPDGTSGLTRVYSGGRWGGYTVDDESHTFGASTTTYVSAAIADGTLDFNTSSANFNDITNYKRIEVVVTDGSGVTGVTDYRGGPGGVHGSGGGVGGTVGKHSVPIMASGMLPSATDGCSDLTRTATSSDHPDVHALHFDATSQEYAQFSIPMPKSWNEGTITARFHWSHPSTTTNFGVVWGLQAVAVGNDDTIDAAFGTAQEVSDTGGTTDDLYITSETSAITVGGSPASQDVVFFRVYRKPGDGSDTMAVDARLHAVELFITTDAGNDA